MVTSSGFRSYASDRIVEHLSRTERATRQELAQVTGLSRTGLAPVLDELVARGTLRLLTDVDSESRAGRPPKWFAIRRDQKATRLVLAAHSRRLRAAIVDSDGAIRNSVTDESGLEASFELTLDRLVSMAKSLDGGEQLSDIRIALPTLVDLEGRVDYHGARTLMPDWVGDVVVNQVQQRLGLPATVANESTWAAVAELRLGALRGVQHGVYVKLGASGTNLSMILDGRIYRGADGLAGQIGHVSVAEGGAICVCGQRGCLAAEIDEQVRHFVERERIADPSYSVETAVARSRAGEPSENRLFEDLGRLAAKALGGAINVLQPRVVVVTGDIVSSESPLLAAMRTELPRHVHPSMLERLDIRASAFGLDGIVIGAGMADTANDYLDPRGTSLI